MRPRCDECKKPITKWQRRRGRLASCGPIGHTAWTADWVVHTECLRKRAARRLRVDRQLAELLSLEERQ